MPLHRLNYRLPSTCSHLLPSYHLMQAPWGDQSKWNVRMTERLFRFFNLWCLLSSSCNTCPHQEEEKRKKEKKENKFNEAARI